MESYIIYFLLVFIVVINNLFFRRYFDSLQEVVQNLDEKVDKKLMNKEYLPLPNADLICSYNNLSNKIFSLSELLNGAPQKNEQPREFFARVGWDKDFIIRSKSSNKEKPFGLSESVTKILKNKTKPVVKKKNKPTAKDWE